MFHQQSSATAHTQKIYYVCFSFGMHLFLVSRAFILLFTHADYIFLQLPSYLSCLSFSKRFSGCCCCIFFLWIWLAFVAFSWKIILNILWIFFVLFYCSTDIIISTRSVIFWYGVIRCYKIIILNITSVLKKTFSDFINKKKKISFNDDFSIIRQAC